MAGRGTVTEQEAAETAGDLAERVVATAISVKRTVFVQVNALGRQRIDQVEQAIQQLTFSQSSSIGSNSISASARTSPRRSARFTSGMSVPASSSPPCSA